MNKSEIYNYCAICQQETKHKIFSELSEDDSLGEYKTLNQIVECLGCEAKCFRIEEHRYLEQYINDYGELKYKIIIYRLPNILKGHISLKGLYNVPEKVREVYTQTILAFKGKSNLLAGIGFRAVIEAICIQEKIKGNNLEIKINNLAKNRLITDKEAERLHSIRFIGNDSVHEMEIPNDSKLFLVLDIIDNLLKNLYILDKQAISILDTIIKEYSDFEDFLWQCSEKLPMDIEYTLEEIFGKHMRRMNFPMTSVEKVLVERINNRTVEFLKLGSQRVDEVSKKQLYIFTGNGYLPF